MSGGQRKSRVEHGLRDVLTQLIASDVRDPRVHAAELVTVSRVELNVDLSVARVYVSVIGDDATIDGVIAALSKAAGFLRGPAGRLLGVARPPELRFFHDDRIDVSAKLAAIIKDDEDRARAAGREPEPRAVAPTTTPAIAPAAAPTPVDAPKSSTSEEPT